MAYICDSGRLRRAAAQPAPSASLSADESGCQPGKTDQTIQREQPSRKMNRLPLAGAGSERKAPKESSPVAASLPQTHHQAKVSERLQVENCAAHNERFNFFYERARGRIFRNTLFSCGRDCGA